MIDVVSINDHDKMKYTLDFGKGEREIDDINNCHHFIVFRFRLFLWK